jgi:hypothetical protein
MLTAKLRESDHDETGLVLRSVLLDLIERAADTAAESVVDGPLRLESLSTGFPATATSETLVAMAEAAAASGVVHVSVTVRELTRTGQAVSIAQAIYSAGQEEEN